MSALNLPVELIDHSLEHLFDDKATLSSCSLVCRSWLNGSRRVLFSTITIVISPGALAEFVEFCQSTSKPEARFPSAKPSQHVRHLRIHGPETTLPQSFAEGLWNPRPPHLEFIISCLEALQSLELRCLMIPKMSRPCAQPKLEELIIVGAWTTSGTEGEILEFLCQLPALRSFRWYSHKSTSPVTCRPSGRTPSAGHDTFPFNVSRLTTLTLRQPRLSRCFMDIIALDPPVKSLTSLEIAVLKESDLTALGRLFDVLGANLCHFGLDISEFQIRNMLLDSVEFDGLHLHTLTSLRSMTLHLTFYGEDWAHIPFHTAMFRSFAQLFSCHGVREHLEVLTFCIGFHGTFRASRMENIVGDYLRVHLGWITDISGDFPWLREIRWEWNNVEVLTAWAGAPREGTEERLNELVQESYPLLHEGGFLRFPDTRMNRY